MAKNTDVKQEKETEGQLELKLRETEGKMNRLKQEMLKYATIAFGAGLGLGAFVLKWQPIEKGEAFLVLKSQLFIVLVLLLGMGFGFATVIGHPWERIKKILIKGKGTPIGILHYGSGGQVHMGIIPYRKTITMGDEEIRLRNPAFTFMGVPGYILHEGCSVSLDWSPGDIGKLKDKIADEIEKNDTGERELELEDGKIIKVTNMPKIQKAFTIQALSATYLRATYTSVYNLAIAHAETKAEKVIRMTMIFALVAFISAATSAWYSYYGFAGLQDLGLAVSELKALITTKAGVGQ